MQIFRGDLDNFSRPATAIGELVSSRVSSVSLPDNGRICSSAPFSLVLTNDAQRDGAKDSGDVCVSATNKNDDEAEEEDDLKLQKAIEEMRRLDKILSVKALQEQEARRKRKELSDRLWQELLRNTPKGPSECSHEASNTRSYLALEAPTTQVQVEDLDFEPVFETEAQEFDDASSHVDPMRNSAAGAAKSSVKDLMGTKKKKPFQESHCEASKSKKKHRDFVKRNIELISCEGGQEVLTQAGKERLDELLREIDQEEEDCAKEADAENDVWAVTVKSGQGYTPEPPDLKHLNDIDSRIRLLLPVEEFASLQASFSNLSEFQGRGSEAGWRSAGDPLPGEKALKDARERRGQERRLQEIQQQLQTLSRSQDGEGPDLTEEQLGSLLEECELAETWTRDVDMNSLTWR